jgi:prolyl-tRNA editing enzyme YbaK/EbsC (Cys-tRNA(Pro) deacylase)
MEDLHPSAARVQAALEVGGAMGRVAQLTQSTATSAQAAAALGVEVGQIGKSLVFLVDEQPVVVVLRGSDRLDTEALRTHLSGNSVRRPDAEEVRQTTGYSIGGVSPVALPAGVPVLIDDGLAVYDVVWVAAGTANSVFPTSFRELVELCAADTGEFRDLRRNH